MYFAWQSPTWGGGIAFYDPRATGTTAGRAWLVTGSQFSDVASQEMHRPAGRDLPLAALLDESGTAVLGPGCYETLHQVGSLDDVPVVTFTASWVHRDVPLNAPVSSYLRTMATGLAEAHGWDERTIIDYLLRCPGVRPAWDEDTLRRERGKNG